MDESLLIWVACVTVGAFAAGYALGIFLGEMSPKPPRIVQRPLSWWRRHYGLRVRL